MKEVKETTKKSLKDLANKHTKNDTAEKTVSDSNNKMTEGSANVINDEFTGSSADYIKDEITDTSSDDITENVTKASESSVKSASKKSLKDLAKNSTKKDNAAVSHRNGETYEASGNNEKAKKPAKELTKEELILKQKQHIKEMNQNPPKPNTYEFFNYDREDTAQVNENGENIHNKDLKSKPSKYKGTLRENDKVKKIFPLIVTICVLIGTAVGIIVGLATGVGGGIAVIIIMISLGIGALIHAIARRRS